jgi:hypothetical protein
MTDLYDVESALREVARYRRRRDQLTTATTEVADRLASHMARHFGPEAAETAGLALVIAAASLGGLAREVSQPEVLVNVLAFAGQRLATDARAADAAVAP